MSQQMKTSVLTLALLCITFCLPQNGQAQDARIAVVDTQALTIASDEGKAVNEKIEKRIQAMGTEMEKLRKDIDGKEERLRTQDRVMAATLKAQLQSEIKEDQIKFERKNQDYQKEIEQMQKSIKELNKKMELFNKKRQDSSGKLPMLDSQLQDYFRL